jgi:uncharacterized flavoprotein (TIGR03862 family)
MAAHSYALKGYRVKIYDHKAAAGRKFLVAGHGGFNLTHSEEMELFLSRYDAPEIQEIVRRFDNRDTIAWLQSIGIPTYTGSSGKIFPEKGIKPIEVLRKWMDTLLSLDVEFIYEHRLVDFDQEILHFSHKGESVQLPYSRAVFALGGQSWAKTGSDGAWVPLFRNKGITVREPEPSNSGLETQVRYEHLAGQPLKNIRLFNAAAEKRGEMVLTSYGIEGSAVYYMNRYVRQAPFPQILYVDLLPHYSEDRLAALLSQGKTTELLKKQLKLKGAAVGLLKTLDRESFIRPDILAQKIKGFPLEVTGFRPFDEVISTFGGVEWPELESDLSLRKYPRIQCCGEMLNWDAPTGGYLLQACFASGHVAGLKD